MITIFEALIALVLASGLIIGVVAASQSAASRQGLAVLQVETTLRANALLARVGADIALQAGRLQGTDESGTRWALDIVPVSQSKDNHQAFEVMIEVDATRGGLSARAQLASFKMRDGRP